MIVNLRETKFKLLMILILLTPFFNYGELYSILYLGTLNQSTNVTPVYIKGIKDILIIFIILIGSHRIFFFNKIYKYFSLLFFMLAVILSGLFTIIDKSNIIIIAAGIRWLLPLLLFFSIYDIIDESNLKRLFKIIKIVFFTHFMFQFYEFFFMKSFHGIGLLGFSLRNPGIFMIPSTGAFFTMTFFLFTSMFEKNKFLKKFLLFFICPISIIFTASGSGIISLFMCFLTLKFFKSKRKVLIFTQLLLVMITFVIYLPIISGRKSIYDSLFIRVDMFFEGLSNSVKIISDNFGIGTNTGVLLSNSLGLVTESFIADSLIISVLINVGFIGFIFLFYFILKPVKIKKNNILYVMVFFPFMITTIMFEVFPSNILFVVIAIYLLKEKYTKKSNNDM